ncbi:MAG: hypothetical protein ACXWIP_24500, partial [Burkholderiales bacterium]
KRAPPTGLTQARLRDAQIVAALESLFNQSGERRVAELAPPLSKRCAFRYRKLLRSRVRT